MAPRRPFPAARSDRLPSGVEIQPRQFEFRELESVPQDWFAGNPIVTHFENAFSILIPPGERFFIRSVRHYEDRAPDAESRELIRAFVQQEGLHSRAHNEFNASIARFGIDVEREVAYAERVIRRMERWLPRKIQLGATVFLEHVTATGAHALFALPQIAESMHPEMLRFWRWHAVEELEHKAVAFDLFEAVGGGYWLRLVSAIAAIAFLAWPQVRIARRMMAEDAREITPQMRADAREMQRQLMGPQLRMLGQYFRRGFHPWQIADEEHLRAWYASAEAA